MCFAAAELRHLAPTSVASDGVWSIEANTESALRISLLLATRGAGHPPETNPTMWDHAAALSRVDDVVSEFSEPARSPFDCHVFWGSWKWIGWFGTEFTWVGRWIMHSVVRGDKRAVSLCIDWLKQGAVNKKQSAALRYALTLLTGARKGSDGAWVKWHEGGLFSSGAKRRYPEADGALARRHQTPDGAHLVPPNDILPLTVPALEVRPAPECGRLAATVKVTVGRRRR